MTSPGTNIAPGTAPASKRAEATEPAPQTALTCPHCGFSSLQEMPVDAWLYFHECAACRRLPTPKRGDCCVFCSYGEMPCPPMQRALDPTAPDCCA